METATKWRPTASGPRASTTHWRAEVAFSRVSKVENVFDETMKSVSAGSRSKVASTRSVESTLDTKRKVMSRRLYQRRAS